jgi:hypothetical protein
LLPNDLIVVRNHENDEEDVWDIKDVLKSPKYVPNKLEIQPNSKLVEIQFNSEFQNLDSNPTRGPGPPCLQIDAQDAYGLLFGPSTYAGKEDDIYFSVTPVPSPTKIGFNHNC